MLRYLILTLLVVNVLSTHLRRLATEDDDYSDESNEDNRPVACDASSNCKLPNCTCFGWKPYDVKTAPQFVMLTFDDAVTVSNIKTYRKIAKDKVNSNGCPIGMTFFVTHEYNDYEFVNELYRKGHEIAVHSITHESNTDTWRDAPESRWRDEMSGMRTMLSSFAEIPASEVRGHRAPFLQTGGDKTFQALKDEGFAYDSSMPTRVHTDPPLWPYTLDFGFRHDCQIMPCPRSAFPGMMLFPMIQWERTVVTKGVTSKFHCSMVDACTPLPITIDDTFNYFMENFNRHYKSNKAPFPVFLHEGWLRDTNRLKGYMKFVDEIVKNDDVFVVTMAEVLHFMRDPIPVGSYRSQEPCFTQARPGAGDCDNPISCQYPRKERFMKSCVPCPRRYPWLGNPEGLASKTVY